MNKSLASFIAIISLLAGISVEAAIAAPSSGDSSSSASQSAPTTGDSSSSAGATAPSTGDSSSSAGPATTVSAPSNPGSSGSSKSGGRRRAVPLAVGVSPIQTTGSSVNCPLITDHMKIGWKNDPTQVAKLQAFLKENQKLDVSVTGIFDAKTEAAVKAFQAANMQSVLGPWNASIPTGVVYITTLKRINQLACNQPLVLNADELAIISNYGKSSSVSSPAPQTTLSVVGSEKADEPVRAVLELATESDTDDGDDEENVAAVGKTSVAGRFWRFIVNIF